MLSFEPTLPYAWDQRQVLIRDRIFHAPSRSEEADSFYFPGWNSSELFGNDSPIHIEYCSGNGTWIADKAAAFPEVNWVAVEMKWARAAKIWAKVKQLQLSNLIIVYGEAQETSQRYFPTACADQAYINFPDPWPKNRHAKHRLVNHSFVAETARLLKPNALFTLVTDDLAYSELIIKTLNAAPYFVSCFEEPFYVNELSNYGSSFFEEFWRRQGKLIRYHLYRRVP